MKSLPVDSDGECTVILVVYSNDSSLHQDKQSRYYNSILSQDSEADNFVGI